MTKATSLLTLIALALAGCASSPIPLQTRNVYPIEWRHYSTAVLDRRITFDFPRVYGDDARFEFDAKPVADRITGSLAIVGMQAGYSITATKVGSLFSFGLSVIPIESEVVRTAVTSAELKSALRAQFMSRVSDESFTIATVGDVLHIGGTDWVYVASSRPRSKETLLWENYYSRWDSSRLIVLHVGYGDGTPIDSSLHRDLTEAAQRILSSYVETDKD